MVGGLLVIVLRINTIIWIVACAVLEAGEDLNTGALALLNTDEDTVSKLTKDQKQFWNTLKFSYDRGDILRVNSQILKHVLISQKIGRVTEPLAECIVWIAERHAHKAQYKGFTYLDDMIAFAVMHMLMVVLKFNSDKSQNPYAFLVQVTSGAFCNFMAKERNQRDIKEQQLEEQKIIAEENTWQAHV